MAKDELGTKRVCPVTGRKFYDLGRDPIVSPYTGISYPRTAFEAPAPTRGGRVAAAATEEETVDPVEAEDAELVSLEDADAEEASTGKATPAAPTDDVEAEEEAAEDDADAFLEEDEDEDTDVADLIDGDIEEDEEP